MEYRLLWMTLLRNFNRHTILMHGPSNLTAYFETGITADFSPDLTGTWQNVLCLALVVCFLHPVLLVILQRPRRTAHLARVHVPGPAAPAAAQEG